MYLPKFVISNQILKNIGVIEGCREVIVSAPIVPAWEKKFAAEATLRTVHYGTAIEGNLLSYDQTREVLEGKDVVARDRDIREILNYRDVMVYLDALQEANALANDGEVFVYSEDLIKKIQALTVNGLIEEGVGEYREVSVVVRSVRSGQEAFTAPIPGEVPFLMEAFVHWLNDTQARDIHSVLRAGITHYVLAAIHPFVEGNGRTARALATLVLVVEGYDIKKLFSLEEHFDREVMTYYDVLQSVTGQAQDLEDRDLTVWLEYFTRVLAIELTRVRDMVRNLSLDVKLKNKVGKQIALSERQISLVTYLKDHESMTMREAREVLPYVSDDTLLRDLRDLMDKKLVKKSGSTKAAKYVLV